MRIPAVYWFPIALLLSFSPARGATPADPQPARDVRALYVPVGFDDNDEVTVVVDGYLDGLCFQVRRPMVDVDLAKKRIVVTAMVQRVKHICHPIDVPFVQVVRLGPLPAGEYTVESGNEELKQPLTVKEASTSYPDDYPYAPVDSLHLRIGTHGEMKAVVRGRFTNTCQILEQVRLTHHGKTLELLPIMKIASRDPQGRPCAAREKGFEASSALPKLADGRYLLHVRSLNGQSANQVFTVPAPWER